MENRAKPSKNQKMRERFDAQLRIGSIAISEIKIPKNSRDYFVVPPKFAILTQLSTLQSKSVKY